MWKGERGGARDGQFCSAPPPPAPSTQAQIQCVKYSIQTTC